MNPGAALHDCVIIGAGPAGLTAAIYLARFRRDVIIIDHGCSRAAGIPVSHNTPGFPNGVSGLHLLERLRAQASHYGVRVVNAEVKTIEVAANNFVCTTDQSSVLAQTILIASGITDNHFPFQDWDAAVLGGCIRLCPVCDGYDVIDEEVAVISTEKNGVNHALFLRTFSPHVALFVQQEKNGITDQDKARLCDAQIDLIEERIALVSMTVNSRIEVKLANATTYSFQKLYPMLGASARSHLVSRIGVKCTDDGDIVVDCHQRTNIGGIYAAGDVVEGLNQIAVATGQAAVAAVAIHNYLPRIFR